MKNRFYQEPIPFQGIYQVTYVIVWLISLLTFRKVKAVERLKKTLAAKIRSTRSIR